MRIRRDAAEVVDHNVRNILTSNFTMARSTSRPMRPKRRL
jgi:hypothetical protein